MKIPNLSKSIVASVIAATLGSSAFAVERPYRIDRHSTSRNGYAIAWGVKGKLVDFEKIEEAGSDAVYQFISDNQDRMENYLVDLETTAVLSNLTEGGEGDVMVSGDIGGVHIGNHFSLGLTALQVNSLNSNGAYSVDAVGVIGFHKWGSSLASVKIIRREAGKVTVVASSDGVGETIESQVRAKIPAKLRAAFDTMSFEISFGKSITTRAGTELMEFTLDGQVPKSDGGMTVSGLIGFKLVGSKIIAKVASVKVKK